MSLFSEILVRIASYGPQIDQSHGENRLSHIIHYFITANKNTCFLFHCKILATRGTEKKRSYWLVTNTPQSSSLEKNDQWKLRRDKGKRVHLRLKYSNARKKAWGMVWICWNDVYVLLGEIQEICCFATGFVPFFEQKALLRTFISHFSRTPFRAKKSFEFISFLVLPQHEQFYPEGLSVTLYLFSY